MASIREAINANDDWEIDFAGSIFSNRQMMKELVVILLISLMLMYFILCARFGSFMQPLIVLLEIPIDTAFALITLWLCGHTLNLMSAIGIIVTCGIVVNDSILKLDAINEYRSQGHGSDGSNPYGRSQTTAPHNHDLAHHNSRYGAHALYRRYGL